MKFGMPRNAAKICFIFYYTNLGDLETQLLVFFQYARWMKWVKRWYINLSGVAVPKKTTTLYKLASLWRKNKRVEVASICHNAKELFGYESAVARI